VSALASSRQRLARAAVCVTHMATSISSFSSRVMSWPVPPVALRSFRRQKDPGGAQRRTGALDKDEGATAVGGGVLEERGREVLAYYQVRC
jgi:hypothetical protein